jgi:hypothetical protein
MVKFFLKGTNQEVSVADKVKITTPIKTPYGEVDSTFEVVVTQASLEQLIKDGLVVKKDSDSLSTYVKYISKKLGLSVKETYTFLNELKDVFPVTHYTLLMEGMSEVMNATSEYKNTKYAIYPEGRILYVGNPKSLKEYTAPTFYRKIDAQRATTLLSIFKDNMPYAKEQKD